MAGASRSARTAAEARAARPFLKWAGGKTQLLPPLLERVPARPDAFFEPFVGGGALFFALAADPDRAPRRAVLNDSNAELVATYGAVRDELPRLVERLAALEEQYLAGEPPGRAALYYRVRDERPRAAVSVAARLIFLNHTCYNGLYRVNRRGEFNVPHGDYRRPRILDRENLEAVSAALQGVDLRHGDFEAACADAGAGDLVYFDPPFHPLSETSHFVGYTEQGFGRADQLRLKWCIDALTARGALVLLSNSPHPYIEGAYEASHYTVERTPARRSINSRADRRGVIDELIVTNEPLQRALRSGQGASALD